MQSILIELKHRLDFRRSLVSGLPVPGMHLNNFNKPYTQNSLVTLRKITSCPANQNSIVTNGGHSALFGAIRS